MTKTGGLKNDSSQRSFNQMRDQSLKSGTFKLFYEEHEVKEPAPRSGLK